MNFGADFKALKGGFLKEPIGAMGEHQYSLDIPYQ